jgi:excisionase family DNA binding protein
MTATTLPHADPILLDIRAVARLLSCSPRHVARLADSGRLPPPLKLGRLIRWRRADLDAFLAKACTLESQ